MASIDLEGRHGMYRLLPCEMSRQENQSRISSSDKSNDIKSRYSAKVIIIRAPVSSEKHMKNLTSL
jgi:hypothetical protein